MGYVKLYSQIRNFKELSCEERMIYSIINSYGKSGCIGSDKYFATWINKSIPTTKRLIKNLEEKGYIKRLTKGTHRKILVKKIITDDNTKSDASEPVTTQEVNPATDKDKTQEGRTKKTNPFNNMFILDLFVPEVNNTLSLGLKTNTHSDVCDLKDFLKLDGKPPEEVKRLLIEYATEIGAYKPP